MAAIVASGLGRTYRRRAKGGDIVALGGVSFDVEEGEVWGLLGPNGAGKTTLVKLLSTALTPTMGTASILGFDVVKDAQAVRRQIGIVFGGDRGLYMHLTAAQNLEFWASIYDVPVNVTKARVAELLERVGLLDRAGDKVQTFSRGMKQRLHLARGLIADARVLFLDEPTIGMDPVSALEFRAIIAELKGRGKTILITTHDMAEAEAVCERVALIDHGQLLAVETPKTLSHLLGQQLHVDFEHADDNVALMAEAIRGVLTVETLRAQSYRVHVEEAVAVSTVLSLLGSSGVISVRTSRPTLEDVYLSIMSPGEKSDAIRQSAFFQKHLERAL